MGPTERISDASLRRRACRNERSLAAEFAHLAAELARAASREYLFSSQTIPAGGDNATFDHQPHRCIAVADITDLLAGREMPGRTTREAQRELQLTGCQRREDLGFAVFEQHMRCLDICVSDCVVRYRSRIAPTDDCARQGWLADDAPY